MRMRVCNKCGAQDLAPEDIVLVREEGGHWSTRCRRCPDASRLRWPQAGDLSWLMRPAQDLAPEILRSLNGLRASLGLTPYAAEGQQKDYRREYERHEVALNVTFRRKDQPEALIGSVHDLSKGGLCFSTATALRPAEIIDVNISAAGSDTGGVRFSSQVEVVRCNQESGDTYKIGGRFLTVPGHDQRRDPRHHLLLTVWYQRKGSEETHEGAVIDISRSGVGFVAKEDIPVGEVLAICIRGDSGAFQKQDLRGLVRVAHTKCVYEGNYELGTEYIKTRVIPRSGGTDGTGGPA